MGQNDHSILDWAKHEGEILDLFIIQNRTLSQVMAHMKEKHNFQASERQYKYRFPNLKNVKAKEWIWLDQEMQRRATIGKESEPCLFGRPLPPDRVIREIARHQNKLYTAIPSNQVPNPCPQRISVRTPPPMTAIPSRPNPNRLDDLQGNRVDSFAPSAIFRESSIEQASFMASVAHERLIELDDAMQIEPGIEDNLFHINLSNEGDIEDDFNWATANFPSPDVIRERTPTFSMSSTPEQQFPEQRLSPFSQFINLEIFDTRPGFQFMANLPWFRFKHLSRPASAALDGVPLILTSNSNALLTEAKQGILMNLLGLKSEVELLENVPQVTRKLQRLVPERYEGELFDKVGQLLNPRPISHSNLWFIFGLAAYFVSNDALGDYRTDTFLKWVIDQKYTDYLERLLQINTPTTHALTTHILKSAVRIKNTRFLTALLEHGVKFDTILGDVFSIGDMEFTKLVFARVDPVCFKGAKGFKLLRRFVDGKHFELARMLVENGVSVNSSSAKIPLLYDAASSGRVPTVTFLLDLGANVNALCQGNETSNTALGIAVARKNPEMVSILLEHGARTSCKVMGMDLLEWSSLNCRNIYHLLKEKVGTVAIGFTLGDLVNAADQGSHAFHAYLRNHQGRITKHQFERALKESIRLRSLTAATVLLQHGVSPDCHTLERRLLWTALNLKKPRKVCDLLIAFKAEVNVPRILRKVVRKRDFQLLQTFVKSGVNLEVQGIEALVEAAGLGDTTSAAFLLNSGVDINTPGLEMNPLQAAADGAGLEMIELLLSYGADINAPAYTRNGRTALQSALLMDNFEVASLLLDKGADIFAPPALLGGVTTLEAVCYCWYDEGESIALCNRLLDLDAPVNRPNGEPSSALHGVIEHGEDDILARMLEPRRNAIINHMWCDTDFEDVEFFLLEPRTPTQLAADLGRLKMVRMLLDHGADINEAPAYRFGRTALQAAIPTEDMELIKFLLDKGADINAKPAIYGGMTALQSAAVSSNIMLAKFLLDNGADVNAAPSFSEGRYAIEGAAEHGRLDMVQLLLNAGAVGNVFRGTGFEYAIKLAEKNHHFAVANLLKTVTKVQE